MPAILAAAAKPPAAESPAQSRNASPPVGSRAVIGQCEVGCFVRKVRKSKIAMSSSAANQVAGSRTQPLGYLRMKPQHVVDIANAGTADNGVTGIIPCDLRLGIGDHSHSRGLGAYLGLFARRVAAGD
ncbi:uncharacterized protein CIMG_08866 [Coccidioides immitis RS]|uniref:Uncharacterized protein n=1 Tax=Coccidioides immitis (strain RS) TaxID=246410 RepID=A0A0E1S1G8_COCIM|nr:uncharacterized protein CIMG_08866 [Coccidioides immitis RS]EAS30120.2 hypothetical protein CIMG_08866 [Coccidioides immitis RS]